MTDFDVSEAPERDHADVLVNHLTLNRKSVLDVGCGKAFLLYEMKKILPGLNVYGFDISKHGISSAKDEIKENLFIHKAQNDYPFENNQFDFTNTE